MSNVKVTIHTQYRENYGTSTNPHWKSKGGTDFELVVDADELLYHPDLDATFRQMVEEQSTNMTQFEYRGYDIHFHDSLKLSAERFKELTELANQKEKSNA